MTVENIALMFVLIELTQCSVEAPQEATTASSLLHEASSFAHLSLRIFCSSYLQTCLNSDRLAGDCWQTAIIRSLQRCGALVGPSQTYISPLLPHWRLNLKPGLMSWAFISLIFQVKLSTLPFDPIQRYLDPAQPLHSGWVSSKQDA